MLNCAIRSRNSLLPPTFRLAAYRHEDLDDHYVIHIALDRLNPDTAEGQRL
jgi:hypothetical protein